MGGGGGLRKKSLLLERYGYFLGITHYKQIRCGGELFVPTTKLELIIILNRQKRLRSWEYFMELLNHCF